MWNYLPNILLGIVSLYFIIFNCYVPSTLLFNRNNQICKAAKAKQHTQFLVNSWIYQTSHWYLSQLYYIYLFFFSYLSNGRNGNSPCSVYTNSTSLSVSSQAQIDKQLLNNCKQLLQFVIKIPIKRVDLFVPWLTATCIHL